MYTLDEAIKLYNDGDYMEAFKAFNTLEPSDDVSFYLGLCYFNGNGCKLNFQKAFSLFGSIAIKKYAKSYFYLGYLYEFGLGVPRNIRQAILWYNYCLPENDSRAMYRLGRLYRNHNKEKAIKYLDMAILQNNISAILLKADLIDDIEEQISLFNKAASLGNKKALFKLSKFYIDNNLKNDNLIYYLNESIKVGNIETYPLYAKVLFNGIVVESNPSLAIKLLEAGAKRGNVESKRLLGDCYKEGKYIEKDLYKAILYYEDCSKNNDLESLYKLVSLYYENDQIKDNLELALFYLIQIANLGEVHANRYLGIIYEKGIWTSQDVKLSYKYYQKAASYGDEYSKKALLNFKVLFDKIYKIKVKEC